VILALAVRLRFISIRDYHFYFQIPILNNNFVSGAKKSTFSVSSSIFSTQPAAIIVVYHVIKNVLKRYNIPLVGRVVEIMESGSGTTENEVVALNPDAVRCIMQFCRPVMINRYKFWSPSTMSIHFV
jgi:hypothetical protein